MLLKFYSDKLSNKILCDFIGHDGAILFTYEITEEIMLILNKVIWFDDLPLTVPLGKLYGFLSAANVNVHKMNAEDGFWTNFIDLLGDTVPISAYRKPIKKVYLGLGY